MVFNIITPTGVLENRSFVLQRENSFTDGSPLLPADGHAADMQALDEKGGRHDARHQAAVPRRQTRHDRTAQGDPEPGPDLQERVRHGGRCLHTAEQRSQEAEGE